MLRSRRFALIATALISVSGVVLAACGDAVDTTGRGLQVFHLGAGGGNAAATVAGGMATADKMMPYMITDFVFDGELPVLADSAASYLLSADPSTADVAALAAALGVKGDVRELAADMGGGWMVGPEDYSGATLTVAGDGLGSWWYSPDPSVYNSTGVTCESVAVAAPDAPTTDTVPTDTVLVDPVPVESVCSTPEPPAGVPTEAEADALMSALLTAVGDDAGRYDFDTYADDWNASVTGYLLVDGVRSPITVGASWGADGMLMWASGSFAVPQRGADYPLAGADVGLVRLNDRSGQWSYYGSPTMLARGGVVGIAADVAADTVSVAPGSDATAPAEPVPADTVPVDTVVVSTDDTLVHPTPIDCDPAADCIIEPMPGEMLTVHLSGVSLGLTMVWDADGTVWLLPAYVFESVDGGEFSVIAIDDEYIDVPEAGVTTPDTALPVDGGSGTSSGSGSIDVAAGSIDPDQATSELVGLREDEATKVAAGLGWTMRVVERDGESLAATMDYRTDRVNVTVTDGVVSAVDSVG